MGHGLVEMRRLVMKAKAGVLSKLKSPAMFNKVYLEHGVATWPGEIDLAPDAMYAEIKRSGLWILKMASKPSLGSCMHSFIFNEHK